MGSIAGRFSTAFLPLVRHPFPEPAWQPLGKNLDDVFAICLEPNRDVGGKARRASSTARSSMRWLVICGWLPAAQQVSLYTEAQPQILISCVLSSVAN